MMTDLLKQVKQIRKQQRRQKFYFILSALAIFLLLGSLALTTQKEWDLSRGAKHSLTNTSVNLLKTLAKQKVTNIKFTAFMSKTSLPRETSDNKKQSELLRELSETSISNALLRLSRDSERFVLFIEGHGERNPFGRANHDLQQFAKELDAKGFVIERFNITQQAAIPSNTRLLVIASPQLNYLPSEIEQLNQYLAQGGNLLWLSDPDGLKGLSPLLSSFGLQSPKGTVIDQGTQELGISDASFSLVSNYNQHPALRNFQYVSLFPQSRAFEMKEKSTTWKQTPLLTTAQRTWLEAQELQNSVSFNPEIDQQGPLNIGFSLTRKIENQESQQRIVLIGDGDFLSNRYLNNGANLPLGLNLFDWLSGEEAFLNITFAETPDTSLNISERNLAWIGLFFLLILPGLCFFIALRIWWKRRNA